MKKQLIIHYNLVIYNEMRGLLPSYVDSKFTGLLVVFECSIIHSHHPYCGIDSSSKYSLHADTNLLNRCESMSIAERQMKNYNPEVLINLNRELDQTL